MSFVEKTGAGIRHSGLAMRCQEVDKAN